MTKHTFENTKEYILCSDSCVNIRLFTDRRSMELKAGRYKILSI